MIVRVILWTFSKEKGELILQGIVFLLLNIQKQKIQLYNASLLVRRSWWRSFPVITNPVTMVDDSWPVVILSAVVITYENGDKKLMQSIKILNGYLPAQMDIH